MAGGRRGAHPSRRGTVPGLTASPTSSKRRRWWIVAAILVAGLVTAAIAIGRGGFTLDLDFAAPTIERRIAAAVDPLRVKRGPMVVHWDGLGTPVVVRAERWALLRTDGETVLDLPDVELALAARPLVRGEVRPLWATISGPRLTVERDPNGVFVPSAQEFGAGADEGSGGGMDAMLDAWLEPRAEGALAGLEWVRVEKGSLLVRDRALLFDWGCDPLSAEIARGHNATLDLAGTLGLRNATTSVEAPFSGALDLRGRRLAVALELAPVETSRLADLHRALAPLADWDSQLGGTAQVTLDAEALVADPIALTITSVRSREPASVRGRARWPIGSSSFTVEASSRALDPTLLAPLHTSIAAVAPSLPLLDVELKLDADSERATASATLRAPADDGPFSALTANLVRPSTGGPSDLALDVETLRPWRLAISEDASRQLAGVEIPLDGSARGTIAEDALALEIAFHGAGGSVQISGVPATPLAIDEIEIRGRTGGTPAAPRLERAELRLRAGAINATGDLRASGRAYAATVRADAVAIERADLDRWWPADLASDARRRVAETFVSGSLRSLSGSAEIELTPAHASTSSAATPPTAASAANTRLDAANGFATRLDALDLAATLDGVELDLLAPQPPLRLNGHARLDLDALHAEVDQARLRELELGPGTVAISGWRGERPALRLDLHWRGPLESVLGLLGTEPIAVIDADQPFLDATGSMTGDLQLETALRKQAERERPRVSARASIDSLAWPSGPLGLAVSRGSLDLAYAADEITVEGDALLGTSPTRLSLRHRLDDAEPRDSIEVESMLDRETARTLGVPEERFVGGAVGVSGSYTGRRDGAFDVHADLDLGPAALELAEAGVAKAAGEPGSARVEAALDPAGTLTVKSLVVQAPEIEADARFIAATEPFQLESATVERLKMGESELGGTIARRADGGWSVAVDAVRLDLRAFLGDEEEPTAVEARRHGDAQPVKPAPSGTTADRDIPSTVADAATSTTVGPGSTPFDFQATAGTLLLLRDLETRRFQGGGSWNGERWDRLSIHGAFDDATRIAFDYDRGAASEIGFQTNDLGRLWSALFARSEIRGGALVVTGTPRSDGVGVVGRAELRDFTLLEAPVFASILTLGTLTNLVGMFESRGLQFKKAQAELEWDGRRLTFANGRAIGPGIALTGGGVFDLAAGTVDVSGTVAPMRTVQRMIAKIPGLAQLVLGRDRAGVIATRFRVTGPTSAPEIHVEPLSTFTPGFLRDVFGARPGRGKKDDSKRKEH